MGYIALKLDKPVCVKASVLKGRKELAHYVDAMGHIKPESTKSMDEYVMVFFPRLGVSSAWALASLENVEVKS